jgi:hypothetical protein
VRKKMSDSQEPSPEDEFEGIVNFDKNSDPEEIKTLWQALKHVYPKLHEGILVKGVIILDRINGEGDRELVWVQAPDMMSWEVLGMAKQLLDDVAAENELLIHSSIIAQVKEEDESDE